MERFVRTGAVQYSEYTSNGHRHRTINRVIHAVHSTVFLAANDSDHHYTLRTHRTPPPALRQVETHHHSTIDPRREKNVVARVQGQLVTKVLKMLGKCYIISIKNGCIPLVGTYYKFVL